MNAASIILPSLQMLLLSNLKLEYSATSHLAFSNFHSCCSSSSYVEFLFFFFFLLLMGTYQLFFPCSSSTTLSVYDHGSPILGSSNDGFHCESSNDSFLGMKTMSEFLDIPRAVPKKMFQSGSKFGPEKRDKKIRKPRLSFQTRSPVDILDDGYRWRKYGQKAVKNNKFPRSYYRCTHEGCKVKKQVQRVTGDEGLVVTTYESIHTHPLNKPTDNFEHILNQMQIYPPLFP